MKKMKERNKHTAGGFDSAVARWLGKLAIRGCDDRGEILVRSQPGLDDAC